VKAAFLLRKMTRSPAGRVKTSLCGMPERRMKALLRINDVKSKMDSRSR